VDNLDYNSRVLRVSQTALSGILDKVGSFTPAIKTGFMFTPFYFIKITTASM